MPGQQIQIWILFIILMFGAIFGCSDSRKGLQEKKPVVEKAEVQPVRVSAADHEAFRKKLAELDIPTYKTAVFVDVIKKSKDGPMLVAVYEVPARHENDYDKVKAYYAAGLKKALVPKGWTEGKAVDNVILYRKGFEIFFVDFSRVVIPPDTMKIRVAFQYGG